jgi:hypothetical protein
MTKIWTFSQPPCKKAAMGGGAALTSKKAETQLRRCNSSNDSAQCIENDIFFQANEK